MDVTFLSANISFTKRFKTSGEVQPYPHIKEMTSHVLNIKSITDLHTALIDQASKGHCLLKGSLKRELDNESRAGATDRFKYTQLLIFDIDGLVLASHKNTIFTKTKIKNLAEQIVNMLPKQIRNISYIVQASASLGMKKDQISMHIFMLLEIPFPPTTIKMWLEYINLNSTFKNQIKLSVNGTSLCYVLDPSVADNSKLIFIAAPVFQNKKMNPFRNDLDRIVLIKKANNSFELGSLLKSTDLNSQKLYELKTEQKTRLRKALGIKPSKKDKLETLTINNQTHELLNNPDKMAIRVYSVNKEMGIVHCNINSGDSHAYWFWLRDPEFMMNFKNEPIFRISDADPDFSRSIAELFDEEIEEFGQARRPIMIRDFDTDVYYNGVYDPDSRQFTHEFPLTPTTKTSEDSFMKSHGRCVQPFVPDAKVIFDPTGKAKTSLDEIGKYTINMYRESPYITDANTSMPELELGSAHKLKKFCPTIHKLMYHMLGNGNEEFERFINWLAFIYQTKEKAQTAWVLTGIQGTGKGLFYTEILKPLFGDQHVPMRTLENLEEKFNIYMRSAMFLVLDEFHMGSSKERKLADKLKNIITEKTIVVRAMHNNQVEQKSYTNVIVLTNKVDAVSLEQTDRRYNVAPRQEHKLIDVHPEIIDELSNINKELLNFAGVLNNFKYQERLVRTVFQNQAKETMRNLAMEMSEQFAMHVLTGNLEYFIDILDIETNNIINAPSIMTAQRLIKAWIVESQREEKDYYSQMSYEDLRILYHVLLEPHSRLSQKEFKHRMERHGVVLIRKRPYDARSDGNPMARIVTSWKLDKKTYKDIIENKFDATDRKNLLAA